MSLAILDSLQSLDSDSKAAFADSQGSFGDAKGLVSKELGGSPINLDTSKLLGDFDAVTADLSSSGGGSVPQPPFSAKELQSQLTSKLDGLTNLNVNTIQQAIPTQPGVDIFQGSNITSEVNQSITNLTSAITGDANFGKLDLPASNTSGFGEFQEFLNSAGNLPIRILDGIVSIFKNFIDKLDNPEELLNELGSEALTDILVTQISSLRDSLPNTAIAVINTQVQSRTQLIQNYDNFLSSLVPAQLDKQGIITARQQVKNLVKQLELSNQQIDIAINKLASFNVADFQKELSAFPNTSGSVGKIQVLATIFDSIENFINGLKQRITTVTEQLKAFAQKIQALIQQAIEKVGEIADKVVRKISDAIETAGKTLDQVAAYLKDAIAKLTAFVDQACENSDKIVQPLKNAFNKFATTAVDGIETLSQGIKQQTQTLETSIANLSQNIEKNLNREELEKKIRELLGKITNLLQSQEVKSALGKAEQGIDQIVAALQKVSLDPAFKKAVTKTNELENKLKQTDVSQLGTAQKAALKLGVQIIKQVDVPGIVNPELKSAFDSVLEPLVDLVNSIDGERQKINYKVREFAPGTLAKDALDPYIKQLVDELNKYKPSTLLAVVKKLYEDLLAKLEVLNPNQLLKLLDELYQKLVNIIESLSPQELTTFLNEKLKLVTDTLDDIEKNQIEKIVNTVVESIGNVEKLLAGLGLDSVLKSSFWQNLEDILTINLQKYVQKVDDITLQITSRVNEVNTVLIKEELTQLRNAIAEYAANRKLAIKTATEQINPTITEYQQKIQELEPQWVAKIQSLKNFTPPIESAVDYTDLVKRLETQLSPALASSVLQAKIDQYHQILQDGGTRLKPSSQPDLNLTQDDDQIIAAFKQVIPNELEQQLTGPIKRILNSLDEILAKPREVLGEVKKVIQKLASAPSELANVLKILATSLGSVIRNAVKKVKETIQKFDFNFITDIYNRILNKIKDLNPVQILNSFYDVSDFKNSSTAVLLGRLGKSNPDAVSRYFLEKLNDSQKTLLAGSDAVGANKALMQGLNNLLKDENFYSPERFPNKDHLSKEARDLIDKSKRSTQEVIRLNRLLLEFTYSEEIIKSLQSIYPFFLDKLRDIYPTELVNKLDTLYAKIVQVIQDFPQALENALNEEYKKVLAAYEFISAQIDKIFKAIIGRLRGLESELGIGLEDISDAYNRLLVALPV